MKKYRAAIVSFLIVLMFMPIGHTLMILIEELWPNHKYLGAGILGFLGTFLLLLGIYKNEKRSLATILGLIAGVLVWTGWVEFAFMWVAEKEGVQPLMENGEIATKPEYLVMLSSVGLLGPFLLYFLTGKNNCTFFVWIQKRTFLKNRINQSVSDKAPKPLATTTFIETIVLLWAFYILLLLIYDNSIAGDRHPITYIVAFGSLIWSLWLFNRLLRIKKFDYAIRYAIPTVIIFWNFIEIIGRWDMLNEVWVEPFEHWIENSLIAASLIFFIYHYIKSNRAAKRELAA